MFDQDSLETLHKQLNKAAVTDDMISRSSVRLTKRGIEKLTRILGVTADDLAKMLAELVKQVKVDLLNEDVDERYAYESDVSGSVMLRDTKSGATHYVQGSEGAKLLREIERNYPDIQGIIAPYFAKPLREFVEGDAYDAEMSNSGGTYNFPYKGNFACARFWLDNNVPKVKVISLVNSRGDEITIDDRQKDDLHQTALEWIAKV